MTKNYYLNQTELYRYFPLEDTILSQSKEGVIEILTRKLSLTKDLCIRFFNISKIEEVNINGQELYVLKKKTEETWGAYFSWHFKEKYNNLSWESLKKELAREDIGTVNNPTSITELFNKPEILKSISEIKTRITQEKHPLIAHLEDTTFHSWFHEVQFYKEQVRAIKEGVNAWLLKKHSFLFLGEMGVGKSMCSTAMVEITKRLRQSPEAKTLVVAPDHLLSKWAEEIQTVNPQAKVEILSGEAMTSYLHKGQVFSTSSLNGKGNVDILSYPGQGKMLTADYYLLPQSLLGLQGIFQDKNTGKALANMLLLEAAFKQRFRSAFTYAIWDESHLLSKPAWATSLTHLAKLAKYNVLATGTSIAGSVADLFSQALAFFPEAVVTDHNAISTFRVSKKVSWRSACEKAFVSKYGSYSYNAYGRNKATIPGYKPEIGVSSEFITHFIIPNSIFLTTEQVWEDKVEHLIFPPILVEMTEEQKLAMTSLNQVAKNAAAQGNKRIFSRYLHIANEYLDNPNVKDLSYKEELLWSPVPFQLVYKYRDTLLPKEEKLIDICTLERSQDRPVVVFVKHLDRLKKRLQQVLSKAGFKVGSLPDSVKATERQNYINKKFLNEKMDILLVNPAKVATGTDLISAPTVLFFNTGFSYFEVGQSERRSYRIGQKRQTRVYYLGYKGEESPSVQEQVLRMIAEKKRAMESIQGNIDEEGLSALLGKQQSSLLNQLVNNMNQQEEVRESLDMGEKQSYYMNHFGQCLSPEDAGRPQLDKALNFIWPNAVQEKEKSKERRFSSFAYYVRFRKDVISSIHYSEAQVFDEQGEMCLFDLLV